MALRLSIASTISEPDRAAVERGLMDHARTLGIATEDFIRLGVLLHDSSGALAGGLVGGTMWGWLEIRLLWVHELHRGQGHGSSLLDAAETEARRRGCRGARLETYDPQALRFYERRGFEPYGSVADYPLDHTRHLLMKRLAR